MTDNKEWQDWIGIVESCYQDSLKEREHPLAYWNRYIAMYYRRIFNGYNLGKEKEAFAYLSRRKGETLQEMARIQDWRAWGR